GAYGCPVEQLAVPPVFKFQIVNPLNEPVIEVEDPMFLKTFNPITLAGGCGNTGLRGVESCSSATKNPSEVEMIYWLSSSFHTTLLNLSNHGLGSSRWVPGIIPTFLPAMGISRGGRR